MYVYKEICGVKYRLTFHLTCFICKFKCTTALTCGYTVHPFTVYRPSVCISCLGCVLVVVCLNEDLFLNSTKGNSSDTGTQTQHTNTGRTWRDITGVHSTVEVEKSKTRFATLPYRTNKRVCSQTAFLLFYPAPPHVWVAFFRSALPTFQGRQRLSISFD